MCILPLPKTVSAMYFYHSKAFAQTALCGSASCEISIFFFICVLLYDIEAVESSCCVFELCICEARCVFKQRGGDEGCVVAKDEGLFWSIITIKKKKLCEGNRGLFDSLLSSLGRSGKNYVLPITDLNPAVLLALCFSIPVSYSLLQYKHSTSCKTWIHPEGRLWCGKGWTFPVCNILTFLWFLTGMWSVSRS